MKRLVIAVDCDDVLVATTPYFIAAYNTKFGTNITLENAHNGNEELWQATAELQVQRLDELTLTKEYLEIAPGSEEISVLKELSKVHSLHLVTARKPEELQRTQYMIDRNLPGVFTSIDLVGWAGSKGEVCRRIGADVLIDDSARHLHDAIEHQGLSKGGAILFGKYPWNEADSSHESLTHCYDWAGVKWAVDSLAEADI
jgi:5'(3')-deoxyribonucleotidase